MISRRYRSSAIKFPEWFMDILHGIMFSALDEAYALLQTLNFMMQTEPDLYLKLISLYAQGYEVYAIAAKLDISRFTVKRRKDKICQMSGFDSVLKIRKMKKLSPLIDVYAKGYEEMDSGMMFAINKLSELSKRELGVLLGIVHGLSRREILDWVSIGDTKYREIRTSLSSEFDIGWLLESGGHENREYTFREDDCASKNPLR